MGKQHNGRNNLILLRRRQGLDSAILLQYGQRQSRSDRPLRLNCLLLPHLAFCPRLILLRRPFSRKAFRSKSRSPHTLGLTRTSPTRAGTRHKSNVKSVDFRSWRRGREHFAVGIHLPVKRLSGWKEGTAKLPHLLGSLRTQAKLSRSEAPRPNSSDPSLLAQGFW
jgi:hypothetical protein